MAHVGISWLCFGFVDFGLAGDTSFLAHMGEMGLGWFLSWRMGWCRRDREAGGDGGRPEGGCPGFNQVVWGYGE